MTYLLDTHTFLWLLGAPEMLPAKVLKIVEDPSAVLALSIVTPWEMAIKTAIGKLDAADILDDFDAVAARGRFTILGPVARQAIHSGRLPFHHRDPFDRLLVAQALELGIPIISHDRVFDLYGVQRIWN